MSWLTPFQNLIIRFKVGSGGSGGSGITEEYLNSKLAAFYTATETKLLNLVNSKLDTYVLKTDFTALNTTVTTNTNNIATLTDKVTVLENKGTGDYLYVINATLYIPSNVTGTLQNPYVKEYVVGGANSQISYDSGVNIDNLKAATLVSAIPMGLYINNTLNKTIPFIITANSNNNTLGNTTFLLTIFNISNNSSGNLKVRFLVSSHESLKQTSAIANLLKIQNPDITINDLTCIKEGD